MSLLHECSVKSFPRVRKTIARASPISINKYQNVNETQGALVEWIPYGKNPRKKTEYSQQRSFGIVCDRYFLPFHTKLHKSLLKKNK